MSLHACAGGAVQPGQGIRRAARSITEPYVALVQLATAGANLTPVAAKIAVHRSVFEANLVFIP